MRPTTHIAILRVRRPGKGLGQRTTLRLYARNGDFIKEHQGPACYRLAAGMAQRGIQVNKL
jgi:hypothetical protein